MFSTINTSIFIMALIYTLSGQLYSNKKIQNNNSNNIEEDINNESTNDNSTNGHWYDWLIENIKTLSIGIYTLALFIIFNLMNNNGKTPKLFLDNFKDSPGKMFMCCFNIIFLFYLTDIFSSNLLFLIIFLSYLIFKHYCDLPKGNRHLTTGIMKVFKSIIPPCIGKPYICCIYWVLFSFILINILLITLSHHEIIVYINTAMTLCVLILIVAMISIIGDCNTLFGIKKD